MGKLRTIPRNGLVWEWLLDGNALDTNDGTKNNGSATNVTYANTDVGMQYKCGVFNGNAWVIAGNSTNLSTWFTTTLWVKPNSNNSDGYFLSAWGSDNGSIFQNWSKFMGGALVKNIRYYVEWATTISAWIWYHLTLTYSSTNKLRIFVNWVLDWTNTTMSWDPSSTTGSWYIWRSDAWGNSRCNLQAVRVYNRELSQDEIYSLYLEWKKKLSGSSYSGLMDWLVAYYDFKWDANDVVGGNNWTVTWATLTTDRFGNANRAYSFNGANVLSIANSGQFSFDNVPFSVAVWIYPTSWATYATHTIIDFEYDWWIWWLLRHEMKKTYLTGNDDQQLSSTLPPLNTWTFITFTSNWTNGKMYFNWVLDYTQDTLTYNWNSSSPYWIWCNVTNTKQWFVWKIWEVMIKKTEFSASEVLQLYNLTKTVRNVYPY